MEKVSKERSDKSSMALNYMWFAKFNIDTLKTITKKKLFEKFGKEFSSCVTYKDGKKVDYKTPEHINWKNVCKIRVSIPSRCRHNHNGGDVYTRDGVAYKIIDE